MTPAKKAPTTAALERDLDQITQRAEQLVRQRQSIEAELLDLDKKAAFVQGALARDAAPPPNRAQRRAPVKKVPAKKAPAKRRRR